MGTTAIFPTASPRAGMYESFYLRAVSPTEPVGVWIRHTVQKRPGQRAVGSVWFTRFDARQGAPYMHKLTSPRLTAPPGAWIEVDGSRMGGDGAHGSCGDARWSLSFTSLADELRHLSPGWLYRAPLPRTKLTSPAPAASFDGVVEVAGTDTLELRGWPGMIGHNWGSEHAERWIWLHGLAFPEEPSAWIDVALGRVRLAGRLTPWVANGALAIDGRRHRIGGLGARGLQVKESASGCSLGLGGSAELSVRAGVEVPSGSAAGWRYADPDGGEHDVVNCSVAALELVVRARGAPERTLRTDHTAAYELGTRPLGDAGERGHDVPLAPFADG